MTTDKRVIFKDCINNYTNIKDSRETHSNSPLYHVCTLSINTYSKVSYSSFQVNQFTL